MKEFFSSSYLLFIVGIIILSFAIYDAKKHYTKVGPAGKSSKIGLIFLGFVLIMLGIINVTKGI